MATSLILGVWLLRLIMPARRIPRISANMLIPVHWRKNCRLASMTFLFPFPMRAAMVAHNPMVVKTDNLNIRIERLPKSTPSDLPIVS